MTQQNRKIAVFFLPPAVGGAERVTITIAKMLDNKLYDVHIAIVGRCSGEIVKFIPERIKIHFIKTRNIWDFTTFKLYRLMRKLKPDVVFCSLMYLNPRVILAARMLKEVKVIVRNNISFLRMGKINEILIKKLYPKADAIILQTEEMRQEMLDYVHIDDSKLHVCFNPIDTERINKGVADEDNPLEQGVKNFVYIGSIKHTKGLDCLIPAYTQMQKKIPNSRLYIVGKIEEASYYQRIVAMANEAGITEKLVWTGFQENPYKYIKYADCFVLPSRVEGLPNVLLDAMYLKVPVVATRSVPVIDRIVTAERGYVVNVDDVEALSEKMILASSMKIEKNYAEFSNGTLLSLFE